MKAKNQQSEEWLDETVKHIQLLRKQAAEHSDVYEIPSEKCLKITIELLKEFQKCERPRVVLTEDGEFVLTWKHFEDAFKAVVGTDGRVSLFENKNLVDHEAFARRLTSIPA
ncbi:MAG TPA: hypothetical protein V6C81_28865 [Planktothrix sp.]|jgi:hypothetical protein